jgi:hypothetical protein
MLLAGRRFGLRLPGFVRAFAPRVVVLRALVVAALGVKGVGALALGVELLARGGNNLAMRCGSLLQPGRLRRFGLGLGLGRTCLRLGFVGECLALLESL